MRLRPRAFGGGARYGSSVHGHALRMGIVLGLALGLDGCFEPGAGTSSPSEEQSVVLGTVLGALDVDNSRLVQMPLPEAVASTVNLSIQPLQLELSPLGSGTLTVTVGGVPDGKRMTAVLLSWPGGDRFMEVPRMSSSADSASSVRIAYTVPEQLCARLCNRVHEAQLLVSVALSDGRAAGRAPLPLRVDCREGGTAALCDQAGNADALWFDQAMDGYRGQYCGCQGLSCGAGDHGFTASCMSELLWNNPEQTGALARCMAQRLEDATSCLEQACDTFGCPAISRLFDMPAACGLEPGPIADELLTCYLERRASAGFLECNQGFSLEPSWFCDGGQDCEGGFDEMLCPLPLRCDSFDVMPRWICNGGFDCSDGSDEQDCQSLF